MKKSITLMILAALPLCAHAQLVNPDFETWINPIDTEVGMNNRPTGWLWTQGSLNADYMFYHPPVADAQSGDYALRLSIWYHYAKDMAYQTVPIDYRPTALKGFYTYSENEVEDGITPGLIPDLASARVYLTKWNDALSQNDTIGTGVVQLGAAADYTPFNCPIVYTSSEIPDTITVLLDCSLMVKSNGGTSHTSPFTPVASVFTVDNLELEAESLGTDAIADAQTSKVYPNPAKDVIKISGFSGEVTVYDSTGKNVHSGAYAESGLDISTLQSGVYILAANDGVSVKHTRFIKQ